MKKARRNALRLYTIRFYQISALDHKLKLCVTVCEVLKTVWTTLVSEKSGVSFIVTSAKTCFIDAFSFLSIGVVKRTVEKSKRR